MSSTLGLVVPYLYFCRTRLLSARDVLFHVWYEWGPALALVAYCANWDWRAGAGTFVLNAIAFMSLYEFGYVVNDVVASRGEAAPRLRAEGMDIRGGHVLLAGVLRIGVFVGATWWLGRLHDPVWYLFYVVMCVVFASHNMLRRVEFRIATFLGLAFFRFYGTIIAGVESSVLAGMAPAVLVFYVFYRALGYMESKGLLNVPGRKGMKFKVVFYVWLIPLSIAMGIVQGQWWMVLANLYFLVFWCGLWALETRMRTGDDKAMVSGAR